MSSHKINIIYNNCTGLATGDIDLSKYSQLLETNLKNAYMVLEGRPNMIIRLGRIGDVKGSRGYMRCGATDSNATVYLIDINKNPNSDKDPLNLSFDNPLDVMGVEDPLAVDDMVDSMDKLVIDDPTYKELYNLTDDDNF